jgi:hypothetical protein
MNILGNPSLREGGILVAQREINLCSCALGGGVGKALSCAGRRGWCFAHMESLGREECYRYVRVKKFAG